MPDRMFPVLWRGSRVMLAELERAGCPRAIPWRFVAPHEAQARENHGGQTLERLAERGGLSPIELFYVLGESPRKQRNFMECVEVALLLKILTARGWRPTARTGQL